MPDLLVPVMATTGSLVILVIVLRARRLEAGTVRRAEDVAAGLAEARPEDGRLLTPHRPLRLARGYLLAAVWIRLTNLSAWAGRQTDWILVSEKRTCVVTGTALAAMAAYLLTELGLIGLITNAESVVVTGVGLYGATQLLRHVRGVHPPDRR
jgi:hypothetical protein